MNKNLENYEITVTVSCKASNDEEANEKFCSMLSQLQ